MSSIKKAEAGEALLIRLYNPSDEGTEASFRLPFFPKDVHVTGLDERPQMNGNEKDAPIIEKSGLVHVALAPKKIITLRIER